MVSWVLPSAGKTSGSAGLLATQVDRNAQRGVCRHLRNRIIPVPFGIPQRLGPRPSRSPSHARALRRGPHASRRAAPGLVTPAKYTQVRRRAALGAQPRRQDRAIESRQIVTGLTDRRADHDADRPERLGAPRCAPRPRRSRSAQRSCRPASGACCTCATLRVGGQGEHEDPAAVRPAATSRTGASEPNPRYGLTVIASACSGLSGSR